MLVDFTVWKTQFNPWLNSPLKGHLPYTVNISNAPQISNCNLPDVYDNTHTHFMITLTLC